MERTGLQRKTVRTLTTLMTAAMMILIFFFSTETADESDHTSGQISREVVRLFYADFDKKAPEEQEAIFANTQHSVRKAAHFFEYTILGALLRVCLTSWFGCRRILIPASLASGTFYACTDELHQMLIDGRSGQWSDVLLDSCGVMAGVMAAGLIVSYACRHIQSEKKKGGKDPNGILQKQ